MSTSEASAGAKDADPSGGRAGRRGMVAVLVLAAIERMAHFSVRAADVLHAVSGPERGGLAIAPEVYMPLRSLVDGAAPFAILAGGVLAFLFGPRRTLALAAAVGALGALCLAGPWCSGPEIATLGFALAMFAGGLCFPSLCVVAVGAGEARGWGNNLVFVAMALAVQGGSFIAPLLASVGSAGDIATAFLISALLFALIGVGGWRASARFEGARGKSRLPGRTVGGVVVLIALLLPFPLSAHLALATEAPTAGAFIAGGLVLAVAGIAVVVLVRRPPLFALGALLLWQAASLGLPLVAIPELAVSAALGVGQALASVFVLAFLGDLVPRRWLGPAVALWLTTTAVVSTSGMISELQTGSSLLLVAWCLLVGLMLVCAPKRARAAFEGAETLPDGAA
jgi:hypothetical protein